MPASQAGRHGFESRRPLFDLQSCNAAAAGRLRISTGVFLAACAQHGSARAVMAFSAHRRPPPPEPPLPEAWIARIRAGDESAFERMFRKYYSPLCRYVAGYLGSRDAA